MMHTNIQYTVYSIIMNKSLHYLLYVENLMYLYKRHFQVYKINYPVCVSGLTIINERLLAHIRLTDRTSCSPMS